MPSHHCIDVRITVNGSPLPEYHHPETRDDEGHPHSRFVEAKTGQAFDVQIKLQSDFDFQFAPYVFYEFFLDECPTGNSDSFKKCATDHRKGILRYELKHNWNTIPLEDDSTEEWKECPITFGALGMSKFSRFSLFQLIGQTIHLSHEADSDPVSSLELHKLKDIGSIRVNVFRCKPRKLAFPMAPDGRRPTVLDEVSEKCLKGKAIKNNIK
jgi:hypothetical protein